jgi:hypothetical protein
LGCQQLEFTIEEADSLVAQAVETLPSNVRAQGFSESIVWKCLYRDGRKSLEFRGILKQRSSESGLTEVPYVICHIHDIYNPDLDACAFNALQLVKIPEIRAPVSLGKFSEFQSVDEAQSALAYLRTLVGTEISGTTYAIEEYVAITDVKLYEVENGLVFVASFSPDGCRYIATSIRAYRNGVLQFGEASRIDGIC